MNKKTLHQLRSLAHDLKPVVMIGAQGLTVAVHEEIERALEAHELIKIRVNAGDREQRKAMTDEICAKHEATLIQAIGHIATVFRVSSKTD